MKSYARSVAFFSFLLLAVAGAAFAAKPVSDPPATADMNVSSTAIQWQPSGSFERMALVVSGPNDFSYTREFAAGATPTLRLQDLGKVADGQYTWQLRVVPHISTETREKLADARSRDDEAAIARIKAEAGLDRDNTISGAFAVLSGSFVSNHGEEPAAPGARKVVANGLGTVKAEDVVTADDEIIQGSLCVGLDCVNNESFGFDTIRLKENNTRIKFQDTSTSSGFPNVNWQLTANDSNSGGLNKFSIDDITNSKTPFTVIAAAPTNSLFVASSGKVGFGNSSPGLNLHITATDTPAIRQEQTSGGGFTAQTWDIGANEANWFVRDLTGGSRLPLRIRPGAPTSSVDISASGKVGVGNSSPTEMLDVTLNQDGQTVQMVENSTNSGTSAAAITRSKSDVATIQMTAQSSTRSLTQFGSSMSGWNQLVGTTGNGLAVGTINTANLILGTNNIARVTIGSGGGVTVSGDFTVSGGTKNFAMPDPADSSKAIYYAALEGPEAGTYFRGTAKTVNGEAVIKLPGYFSRITEATNMTVQLTPDGKWGQIYVASKSPEELVVKVAQGDDVEFDYLVQGLRKGYADFKVIRDNTLPQQ